jgi:putative oxidoreductase
VRPAADVLALLGRVLISALFLWAGVTKALAPAATQAMIAREGVGAVYLAYYTALGLEIGAGLMLLLGWKTRLAALLLAGWCVATAAVVHGRAGSQTELMQLLKDLAIAGGLVQTMLAGAGRFALDRR